MPPQTPRKPPKLIELVPEIPQRRKPNRSSQRKRSECTESSIDHQIYKQRDAEICFADDGLVKSQKNGECYASLVVTKNGDVASLNYMGCMDETLVPVARTAFLQRKYLPALENGRPIESIVEAELKYGQKILKLPNGEIIERLVRDSDVIAASTINRDAAITNCPLAPRQANLKRSGHCIAELDISADAKVTKIRTFKCTEAHLSETALKILNQCQITAAISDEEKVERAYFKYQIDIDIFDENGALIPAPAAFGENVRNKPYIVFE